MVRRSRSTSISFSPLSFSSSSSVRLPFSLFSSPSHCHWHRHWHWQWDGKWNWNTNIIPFHHYYHYHFHHHSSSFSLSHSHSSLSSPSSLCPVALSNFTMSSETTTTATSSSSSSSSSPPSSPFSISVPISITSPSPSPSAPAFTYESFGLSLEIGSFLSDHSYSSPTSSPLPLSLSLPISYRLKSDWKDFIVEEIDPNGQIYPLNPKEKHKESEAKQTGGQSLKNLKSLQGTLRALGEFLQSPHSLSSCFSSLIDIGISHDDILRFEKYLFAAKNHLEITEKNNPKGKGNGNKEKREEEQNNNISNDINMNIMEDSSPSPSVPISPISSPPSVPIDFSSEFIFFSSSAIPKDQRTKFHQIIKTQIHFLLSDTVEVEREGEGERAGQWKKKEKREEKEKEKESEREKDKSLKRNREDGESINVPMIPQYPSISSTSSSPSRLEIPNPKKSKLSINNSPSHSQFNGNAHDRNNRNGNRMDIADSDSESPSPLVTVSVPAKCLRVHFLCFVPLSSIDNRHKWQESPFPFVNFSVLKRLTTTMDSLSLLSSFFRVSVKTFGFAGNKDRDALTVQRVSAFKLSAERLKNFRNKNIKILPNFSYSPKGISLGDLAGNRFTLVLRDISVEMKGEMERRIQNAKQMGFLNYFGLQRFGGMDVPNHLIGMEILKSQWESAVKLILKPKIHFDNSDTLKAKTIWNETQNAKESLLFMPMGMRSERILLNTLDQQGKSAFLNAIFSLPRPIRMLYIHSVQSLMWNLFATKRIQMGGNKPMVGDIVWKKQKKGEKMMEMEVGHPHPNDIENYNGAENENETEMSSPSPPPPIHFIEESDLLPSSSVSAPLYSLSDVLIPLVGYETQWPKNYFREEFLFIMAQFGLSTDSFRSTKQNNFHSSGDYRKLIAIPMDIKYTIRGNQDDNQHVGIGMVMGEEGEGEVKGDGEGKSHQVDPNDSKCSCHLTFSLPSSCYATMIIREIMRELPQINDKNRKL